MSQPTPPPGPRSVRLVFTYEDDQVRLVLQQPVDLAVTGFDLPREATPGDHVEVRDAEGNALSRVPIRVGLSASAEVFPEHPGEPITRTDLPRAQGAFTVVVPVDEVADHVTVLRVPAGDVGVQSVTELASFPLEGR
ncbi:hypothetical protein [Saccharothrix coeruleofusca]|uniref:Uncharacterized protein n=1 Tax=Saccharothrix coeruleofusca TaxID=33919 RepID=A0A918AIF6_9PSEU|nr:hypothetical protein [Saccharothrix coeruleofusca]MBP2334446.1 hypothetical protein [Saccharothrix coeruleofusca]GGP40991.1 hypothetical protein GCM10010185_10100 [Saccharothrix coeruleofusca]